MRRGQIIDQLKLIEQEFHAARLAVELLELRSRSDPTPLHLSGISVASMRECRRNLEKTYVVRLFAQFEAGLREIWASVFRRRTEPRTWDLINGAASRRRVPARELEVAHRAREFRNSIVHGGPAQAMTLAEIRVACARFFRYMPEEW